MLSCIYKSWFDEQTVRHWESLRLRGYERLYRGQYEDSFYLFNRAKSAVLSFGKHNYRYALSLEDLSLALSKQKKQTKALALQEHAVSILSGSMENLETYPLAQAERRILASCRLARLKAESSGSMDSAWSELKSNLGILQKMQNKIDPFILRTFCTTLVEMSQSARDAKLNSLADSMLSELSQLVSGNSELSQYMSISKRNSTRSLSGRSLDELLALASKKLKQYAYDDAEKLLDEAQLLADKLNSGKNDVMHQYSRLRWSQSDYESSEKLCLALMHDKDFNDLQRMDDNMNRLAIIYKHCGEMQYFAEALREQIRIRSKIYSSSSWKTNELRADLAKALLLSGDTQEVRMLMKEAKDSYLNDFAGRPSEYSERLAAALARLGDPKMAREMLEAMVYRYESGASKHPTWGGLVYTDLAALDALEGKRKESLAALSRLAGLMEVLSDIDPKYRIAVAEGLSDWALFLEKNGKNANTAALASADFIRHCLETLPVPQNKREACRARRTIESLKLLCKSQPSAFTKKYLAKYSQLLQAESKFPPVKLIGISNYEKSVRKEECSVPVQVNSKI